jgi:hypothetical protein
VSLSTTNEGPLSPSLADLRARISRAVDPNSWLALSALIDRDECSDLLLRLGDGSTIHAHRIVLAMRSDRLRAALVELEAAQEPATTADDPARTTLHLPLWATSRAVRAFLQYLYCDTLPPLSATLFVLHADRRQKQLAAGDESDSDVDDVVGQLLHLARLYATKPLEDFLEKMVALPRLAAAAALDAPSPVSNTLASDLLAAFEQPLFSDLTFVVAPPAATDDCEGGDEVAKNESGDKEKNEDDEKSEGEEAQANVHPVATDIVAHKCLLAPRSDYFRAMFLTGLREATQRRVPIVGLRPEVFRQVVRYHYSGFVGEVDPELVVELFVAGNEFDMAALVRPCERMIERGLDLDTVNDLWGMANTFASEQLKQLCIAFLLKQLRPKKIGTGRVAALSLDLLEAVCTRMIATPDSSTAAVPAFRSELYSDHTHTHTHHRTRTTHATRTAHATCTAHAR